MLKIQKIGVRNYLEMLKINLSEKGIRCSLFLFTKVTNNNGDKQIWQKRIHNSML